MEESDKKGINGFTNLGNTCYINSCIQVLFRLDSLNHFFDHKEEIEKHIDSNKIDTLLLLEYDALRQLYLNTTASVISPNKFLTTIHKIAKYKDKEIFTGFAQNDMPEFLMFLIDSFHNSMCREVRMNIKGKPQHKKDHYAITCYKGLKDLYEKEYSEILPLFFGHQMTQIMDIHRKKEYSIKSEPFFLYPLAIPNKNDLTLHDLFVYSNEGEELTGVNAWYNEKTNKKEDVWKMNKIWSFPKIMILQLKRFHYNLQKNRKVIDFPIDYLDVSKYVVGYDSGKYKYHLVGVINHMGNIMGGHYTAYVKKGSRWLCMNDTNVFEIDEPSKIVSEHAYCLFYERND